MKPVLAQRKEKPESCKEQEKNARPIVSDLNAVKPESANSGDDAEAQIVSRARQWIMDEDDKSMGKCQNEAGPEQAKGCN